MHSAAFHNTIQQFTTDGQAQGVERRDAFPDAIPKLSLTTHTEAGAAVEPIQPASQRIPSSDMTTRSRMHRRHSICLLASEDSKSRVQAK